MFIMVTYRHPNQTSDEFDLFPDRLQLNVDVSKIANLTVSLSLMTLTADPNSGGLGMSNFQTVTTARIY